MPDLTALSDDEQSVVNGASDLIFTGDNLPILSLVWNNRERKFVAKKPTLPPDLSSMRSYIAPASEKQDPRIPLGEVLLRVSDVIAESLNDTIAKAASRARDDAPYGCMPTHNLAMVTALNRANTMDSAHCCQPGRLPGSMGLVLHGAQGATEDLQKTRAGSLFWLEDGYCLEWKDWPGGRGAGDRRLGSAVESMSIA